MPYNNYDNQYKKPYGQNFKNDNYFASQEKKRNSNQYSQAGNEIWEEVVITNVSPFKDSSGAEYIKIEVTDTQNNKATCLLKIYPDKYMEKWLNVLGIDMFQFLSVNYRTLVNKKIYAKIEHVKNFLNIRDIRRM